MSFVLDASANSGAALVNDSSGDYQFNHTVASGANLLVVTLGTRHNPVPRTASVTYDGAAMTSVGAESNQEASTGTYNVTQIYYLVSPASGTNVVDITFNGPNVDFLVAGANSFFGGAAAPLDTSGSHDTTTQVSTATTGALTADKANSLFIDVIMANNGNTGTATDPTRTAQIYEAASGSNCSASSYILSVAAGADTYNYPVGGTDYMSYYGAIFTTAPVGNRGYIIG